MENLVDFQTKEKALIDLYRSILNSKNCCKLALSRTKLVPGEGNPDAKIMFIGEAPGKNEDEQGKPFVGAAGKLLGELLNKIGLQREDVFIANVLKCRPPNNRDPLPEEASACLPWLQKQVEIIDPSLIIPLGRHAMERFLPGMKISAVRGKILRRNVSGLGYRVFMPTYHPAAVLYHREWLGLLEEDFKKIPKILEYLKENPTNEKEENNAGDWDSLEIGVSKHFEQGKLL